MQSIVVIVFIKTEQVISLNFNRLILHDGYNTTRKEVRRV